MPALEPTVNVMVIDPTAHLSNGIKLKGGSTRVLIIFDQRKGLWSIRLKCEHAHGAREMTTADLCRSHCLFTIKTDGEYELEDSVAEIFTRNRATLTLFLSGQCSEVCYQLTESIQNALRELVERMK